MFLFSLLSLLLFGDGAVHWGTSKTVGSDDVVANYLSRDVTPREYGGEVDFVFNPETYFGSEKT